MCTVGPNDNLWLTEATGIDANGCDMLNAGNFSHIWTIGGCCGSTCGQNEELEIL